MKYLRLFVCAASLLSSTFIVAQAADNLSINVTGKVVAGPCQIDPNDLVKNISLGDNIPAQDTVGTMGETQDFTITFTNCPKGTSGFTATFSGTPASINPESAYANTATENPAKNVALVLQKNGDGSGGLGNGQVWNVDASGNQTPVLHMQTSAYSLGNATPGNISTSIVMSLEYN